MQIETKTWRKLVAAAKQHKLKLTPEQGLDELIDLLIEKSAKRRYVVKLSAQRYHELEIRAGMNH